MPLSPDKNHRSTDGFARIAGPFRLHAETNVRARLVDLAGGDPEDAIVPLLEKAIGYLCLPRRSPPSGPSVIGMQVFGSGSSQSDKAPKKGPTSLGEACIAAVEAKANGNEAGENAPVKAKKGMGTRGRSVAATRASSIPRKRSASPTIATSASSRHKPQTLAVLAREKAAAKAAEALLKWDAESLGSLLNAHQAMSKTLLRMERTLRQATGSAPEESQGSSRLNTTADVDLDGDGAENRHHRPESEQSTELLKRAEASLTVALAAAGVEVRPATPSPLPNITSGSLPAEEAGEGETKNSSGGEYPLSFSPRPSSSPTPPSANKADGDESGDPTIMEESCIPITVRRVDPDHEEAQAQEPRQLSSRGEPTTLGESSISITVRGDDVAREEIQEPRQRRSRGASKTGVVAAVVDPKAMAKLYGMRCTVKEGLGLIEDAFRDCREALAAVPEAPKLWGKAASLALRIGSEAERDTKRTRARAGVLSIKAYSDGWATEVSGKNDLVCAIEGGWYKG